MDDQAFAELSAEILRLHRHGAYDRALELVCDQFPK